MTRHVDQAGIKGIHSAKITILTCTNSVASRVSEESSPLDIFNTPGRTLDLYRSHFPSTSPHANTLAILDLPIEGSFCEWNQESFPIRLLPNKFSKFIHNTVYHSFIHGNICSIVSLDRTHLLMALGVCEQYGCQCHPQQWCLVDYS